MADSRLLFAVLLAGLATGCNPTLRGECSSQSDCATGLVCFNQLCVNPRWVPDGGSSCSPACASGQSCVSGTCVSSEGVGIQIVSPIGGAALLGKPLEVAVQAVAPDPISAVEVRLMTRDQVIQQIRAEVKNDTYLATLDLADPNITDGYYQLVARMYRGEQKDDSTPVHVVIDKTGPSLAMLPIEYPTRASGSPSEGSFLRDEQVVIDVSVSDPLTGLSSEPPVLKAFGMDPVIGVPKAGHVVRFTFSARAPVFRKVLGEVNVTVLASDVAGNTSTLAASFRLSRLRWSWTKPGSKGTSTAPAVLGNLLVIGGDDSSLHAVRREDGSAAWDMSLAGKPVGHITAGQSRVYAALSDGHVVAIDPQEGSVPQRVVFTCPAQPTFPGPRAMVSGLALGMTQISGMNTVLEETLFA